MKNEIKRVIKERRFAIDKEWVNEDNAFPRLCLDLNGNFLVATSKSKMKREHYPYSGIEAEGNSYTINELIPLGNIAISIIREEISNAIKKNKLDKVAQTNIIKLIAKLITA